ncbi:hypothetical protein M431DRAFT_249866 [Trichoderma harzianum CBS 226.95]|uniref:Uncharacterized protein n=1 Tax=Trichoderma harzianum CBS 226.95 TaxID=983964 RepID=A0A2T4A002_TRIHA|nr:hypothetical protein M431DRAFT_249866 [Trichoderma harzianum CBS 226.95]PTB50323.1 hypothetical protein M431DRAFT_249866 [Trichoderma harzianum CBS 226.95]
MLRSSWGWRRPLEKTIRGGGSKVRNAFYSLVFFFLAIIFALLSFFFFFSFCFIGLDGLLSQVQCYSHCRRQVLLTR